MRRYCYYVKGVNRCQSSLHNKKNPTTTTTSTKKPFEPTTNNWGNQKGTQFIPHGSYSMCVSEYVCNIRVVCALSICVLLFKCNHLNPNNSISHTYRDWYDDDDDDDVNGSSDGTVCKRFRYSLKFPSGMKKSRIGHWCRLVFYLFSVESRVVCCPKLFPAPRAQSNSLSKYQMHIVRPECTECKKKRA